MLSFLIGWDIIAPQEVLVTRCKHEREGKISTHIFQARQNSLRTFCIYLFKQSLDFLAWSKKQKLTLQDQWSKRLIQCKLLIISWFIIEDFVILPLWDICLIFGATNVYVYFLCIDKGREVEAAKCYWVSLLYHHVETSKISAKLFEVLMEGNMSLYQVNLLCTQLAPKI